MLSLIIKVSHKGMSQEFLFNRPGPIVIGQDEACDLCLKNYAIGDRAFELKVSGDKIFVKSISSQKEIVLNSLTLPKKEEILYKEESNIVIGDVVFQVKKSLPENSEIIEPPPFSLEESKNRLREVEVQIREKKIIVSKLSEAKEKKKRELAQIEEAMRIGQKEKNRLELEVGSFLTRKEILEREIKESLLLSGKEKENVSKLQEFIKRLELEEKDLKEAISSQTIILTNLKEDREKKGQEINQKRNELINLETEEVKLKRGLKELEQTLFQYRREIDEEEERIKEVLLRSEEALNEYKKIENDLSYKFKEKTVLEEDLIFKQDELKKLEVHRADLSLKLNELRLTLNEKEDTLSKTKGLISEKRKEEEHLKKLNAELRIELSRAEEKLSFKKDQLNNLDFKNEDATRKLSSINYELERTVLRLEEFSQEEKTQALKIEALRLDMDSLVKKFSEEKKCLEEELSDKKKKFSYELREHEKQIAEKKNEYLEKLTKFEETKLLLEEVKFEHRSLLKEKDQTQKELEEYKIQKETICYKLNSLKEEIIKIENDKTGLEREIASLEIRVLDMENKIIEDEEKAKLDIESLKRETRARLASEKEVSLNEVEAYKQKAQSEMEEEFRRKQDELSKIKEIAEKRAQEIVQEARVMEKEMTLEAHRRLREITQDVEAREKFSHQRVEEAHNYLKKKEEEAEEIILKAKLDARELARKKEEELINELHERKVKIKNFLTHKRNIGDVHLKRLKDAHIAKMKRNEILGLQKIEEVKKKELKKIAKLCSMEFEKQQGIREKMMGELNAEKMRKIHEINLMRETQEKELAAKKKKMLEHINTMKFEQTKLWKEELQREKDAFKRTKKDRVNNATQAVMNLLISEIGNLSEKEEYLKNKIQRKIEMTIDGQDAFALSEVDHVLDFDPAKRKRILPVLKKYTVKVVLPVACAIAIVFDIAGVRTLAVNEAQVLLKEQEAASKSYAIKQVEEWQEKNSYHPETTPGFKEKFVDNILYTTDFKKVVDDEKFQNDWILKLNDFMVGNLELSEDIVISYISSESALIQELTQLRKDINPKFLDVSLEKMKETEAKQLGWLEEKIADPEKIAKFKNFRKEYFDQYYEDHFVNPERAVASEPLPLEESQVE